jgi:hypothetical protein
MALTHRTIAAAQAALDAYSAQPGFGLDEPETNVVDLIADLLLLAWVEMDAPTMAEISESALFHAEEDLSEKAEGLSYTSRSEVLEV